MTREEIITKLKSMIVGEDVHCGGHSFEVTHIVSGISEWDAKITFNRIVCDDYPSIITDDITITKIEKLPTREEKNMITKEQVIENIKFAGRIKKQHENLPKALSSIKIENDVRVLAMSIFELKEELLTMLDILEAMETYDEIDAKFRLELWKYGDFDFNTKEKEIVMHHSEHRYITVVYNLKKEIITNSNAQDLYNNCNVWSDGHCYWWRHEIEQDVKFQMLKYFCEKLPELLETFNTLIYNRYINNKELNELKKLTND